MGAWAEWDGGWADGASKPGGKEGELDHTAEDACWAERERRRIGPRERGGKERLWPKEKVKWFFPFMT